MSGQECPPNLLGITDPKEFREVEAVLSGAAIIEIVQGVKALPKAHNAARLRAIHEHLFRQIFDHAGQFRRTPLAKPAFQDRTTGGITAFAPVGHLDRELAGLFADLRSNDYFKGLGRIAFRDAATDFLCRLNLIHPFEEGNGRTQRTCLQMIALEAGHHLPFECVTSDRMVAASVAASKGERGMMRDILDEQLDPVRLPILKQAHRYLSKHYPATNDRFVATTTPGVDYSGTFVTSNSTTFIFHDGGNGIFVGNLQDVGAAGPDDRVRFTAGRTPEQAAQRWLDEAENDAPRGRAAAGLAAAIASMPSNAPNAAAIRTAAATRSAEAAERDRIYGTRVRSVSR